MVLTTLGVKPHLFLEATQSHVRILKAEPHLTGNQRATRAQ